MHHGAAKASEEHSTLEIEMLAPEPSIVVMWVDESKSSRIRMDPGALTFSMMMLQPLMLAMVVIDVELLSLSVANVPPEMKRVLVTDEQPEYAGPLAADAN